MPRACTICAHAERVAIDAALAAGVSYRDIALQFAVGFMAVQRHASIHVAQAVAQSQAASQAAREAVAEGAALDVVKQLRAINSTTTAILQEAREAHDGELALKAVDRLQRQIELQAKLLGDLDERSVTQVALIQSPDWQRLRSAILAALAPYPEARLAVAAALASEVGA